MRSRPLASAATLATSALLSFVSPSSSQEPENKAEAKPAADPAPAPAAPAAPAVPGGDVPIPAPLPEGQMPPDPSLLPQGLPDGSALPIAPVAPIPSGPARRSQVITLSPAGVQIPLKGVTLIPDKRVRIGDRPPLDVIPTDGVNLVGGIQDPPAKAELLREIESRFLNKPLTFGGLEDLVKLVENHYIRHGRQLTHAFVPSQVITDKIAIAILEGKVTKLDAKSVVPEDRSWWASWYDEPYSLDKILGKVRNKTANLSAVEPVELNKVLLDLNQSPWARLERPVQHPFRRVTAKYSPVEDYIGQTEVTLLVEQKRPLRFFTGYDNALTELLGEDRLYAGLVWYDAFALNLDHQLAIQYFTSPDGDFIEGVAGSYIVPWTEKQTTEIYAAYSESVAGITIGGIPSDVTGESTVVGFRHYYELPPIVAGGEIIRGDGYAREADGRLAWWTLGKRDRQSFGIFHEVGAGLDFKSTDNNLQFGGATVTADSADILQLVLEYNARQTDAAGETTLSWKNYFGIGGSSDDELNALRNGAESSYWYTKVELDREQDLPWGMLAHGRLTGQYATDNLLQSEQLGFGGYNSVRGFPERSFRGDSGWLLSLELYSPAIHPLGHLFPSLGWADELRFLIFTDWGSGSASQEFAADPLDDDQTIGSVGIGLRYDVNDNLRLRVDYGIQVQQLDEPPFPEGTDENQTHIGLVWTF